MVNIIYPPIVVVLVVVSIISLQLVALVQCVELDVGGKRGWVTPRDAKEDDHDFYNDWASGNRFKANDTLRFKYDKDSVMEVTEEEYERCRSSHPMYFSNNGETLVTLDRPGLYYFISGVSGHCQRGLRMIVKVLELPAPSDKVSNQTTPHKKSSSRGNADLVTATSKLISMTVVVVASLFGVM